MSKFSVKKPLTVFVAVIAVLVLGVVAFTRMTPDLLPNMDFPYIIVMTPYPGATPEKVETAITKPLEQAMATLENIEEISSNSAENYSLIVLEFNEDVNMDTITVDILQKVSQVEGNWEDTVGTPRILKMNPSMLPVMVSAVSVEGMDNIALSSFVEDTLLPELEGTTGVASITASGVIEQNLNVVISEEKLDALNEKLFEKINAEFEEPQAELDDALLAIGEGQEKIEDGKKELSNGRKELETQTEAAREEIADKQGELAEAAAMINAELAELGGMRDSLTAQQEQLAELQSTVTKLETTRTTLAETVDALAGAVQVIETYGPVEARYEAEMEAIRNDVTLSEEEKQQKIAALFSAPEYLAAKAALAQVDLALSMQGLTRADATAAYADAQAALAGVDAGLAEIDAALAGMGLTRADIPAAAAQLQEGLAQVNEGISALQSAKSDLSSGKLQLEEALETLETEKANAEKQLNSAAAKLKSGEKELANALEQAEDGLAQLEEARAEALKQADLHNIVTMEMVANILKAQNFAMPAGYVEEDGVSWLVSVGDEIKTLAELENLLLFDTGMEGMDPIYLRDVADVFVTDNAATLYSRINGNDGVMLTFQKQSTAATAEVSDNIRAKFDALSEKYEGLAFVPLMDQGDYIYIITDSILSSLLWGALFAVIILFLFLRDLRPTFITLCSIPISVVFAFVLMYFSGVTLNMISLSGLAVAVGMLVDNSVVVIENIYRLRSQGASAVQAAVSGAKQVAAAITSSTLTTVCVFLPIVFVEGLTRQLFTDMALTIAYALLASLIVALTLVPAMSSGLLRKAEPKPQRGFAKFLRGYEKLLRGALRHKAPILIACLLLLVGSIFLTVQKGFIFMPKMDMPQITVNLTMPEGTKLEDTKKAADETVAMISEIEGVETVGAMLSSGGLMSAAEEQYAVSIYVTVREDGPLSGNEVAAHINELAEGLPYEVNAAGSGSMMNAMTALSGSGVTINVYGNDLNALQESANAIAERLAAVEGTANVSNGIEDPSPVIKFTVDKNAAMEKGLTTAQVYMEIASALQTEVSATEVTVDDYTYEIAVTADTVQELTPDYIRSYAFTVTGRDGTEETVTLGEICTITEGETLSAISRIDQRRYLTVSAEIASGYNVTLVTGEAEKALSDLSLPSGVTYAFEGENEQIMSSLGDLALMLLLGVLLVYFIMVAQFQSLKSPFIVMFTIPLAFTGGLIALLLCGQTISIIAMIGFVMLVGVIVNNGIVLVDYINQLRLAGMERIEAIVEAGMTRMRPILMTSITTILGLIVMALGIGTGTEMMQPIAIVCIGGLIYATALTLFVVPVIYDMMNKKELRKVAEEELVELQN